jgi:hypothetical protein
VNLYFKRDPCVPSLIFVNILLRFLVFSFSLPFQMIITSFHDVARFNSPTMFVATLFSIQSLPLFFLIPLRNFPPPHRQLVRTDLFHSEFAPLHVLLDPPTLLHSDQAPPLTLFIRPALPLADADASRSLLAPSALSPAGAGATCALLIRPALPLADDVVPRVPHFILTQMSSFIAKTKNSGTTRGFNGECDNNVERERY